MKHKKYINDKESEIENKGSNNGFIKKWYEEYPKAEAPFKHSKSEVEVLDLKEDAKIYLNAETSAFQLKQSHSRDSETTWLKTALTRGTSSDKVAASIVLIQDNPKYSLVQLKSLISQARVAKHNQCNLVITSLKDLFLSDLLHPKFKLLKFEDQNLDEIDVSTGPDQMNKIDVSKKKILSHWYFEDQLREQYERFVSSLGTIASDTVEANREKAISIMTDLLIANAEQEQKLLELIVNKIGDPTSKVASKAVFCLNKLLYEHPNMKMVVLREIEKLLFRKNMGQRAQYYGICLLTQFGLRKTDIEIANSLTDVYFAFFKACLKKGEPDSRMMAAILTGVNRAYQFAKIDSEMLNKHIDSVYKVVHVGSFNVSLNALNLLYQVSGRDNVQQNRFYSAFYRKLLDPQIGIANKRTVILNLLYRALQNDPSVLRSYVFIKRILHTALYFPANMTCALLYTISKVLHKRKDLRQLFTQIKTIRETKNDTKDTTVNEIELKKEGVDVNEDQSDFGIDSAIITNIGIESNTDLNEDSVDIKDEVNEETQNNLQKTYDPFCRNPLYTGVMHALNSELIPLSKHFHPSVTLFANTIIQEKPIEYTGDPLQDLTLIRFLDRYVFKNPKKLESKKVVKKNNPLAYHTGYTPRGIRTLAVDSMAYLNEREERIPVDELFLYRYMKRKNISNTIKSEDDSDNESVNSEEFNDMLDKLHPFKDVEDLDIAGDIGTIRKTKKDVEADEFDESEEVNEEDGESNDNAASNISEESVSELEDMEDLGAEGLEDDDLSDIEFTEGSDIENDELSEDISDIKDTSAKNRYIGNKRKEKRKDSMNNIFVSAEKFAQMLEEQSRTKDKPGGTNMMNTIDGASSKQIDWEIKRNQKLRGTFDNKKRKGMNSRKKGNIKRIKC